MTDLNMFLISQLLCAARVPVLILSAGLGEWVEAVLKLHHALFYNVDIMCNHLDVTGHRLRGYCGFPDDIIYPSSKNEVAIKKIKTLKVGTPDNLVHRTGTFAL